VGVVVAAARLRQLLPGMQPPASGALMYSYSL
jgi:hypothetical protein